MAHEAYFSIMHALHGLTLIEAEAVLCAVRNDLLRQAARTRVDEDAESGIHFGALEPDQEFWRRFVSVFGPATPPRG